MNSPTEPLTTDFERMRPRLLAYYCLLQIAHLLWQLVEKGSLHGHLAQEQGKRTAVELFGSLRDMAQRLLDSLRYQPWPDEAFDRAGSGPIQIRLDSS